MALCRPVLAKKIFCIKMDIYLNTTLKNYFGFPENYQVIYHKIGDRYQCILQSSIPDPQLLKLLNNYLTEFEQYLKRLIRYEHPNADQIVISILSDRIIVDFILLDFKQILDDYLIKLGIKIDPCPLEIDDGIIVDYHYYAVIYPQIRAKNRVQFDLKVGDFNSSLRDKIEDYLNELLSNQIYAVSLDFIWPEKTIYDLNFHLSLEIIISLSRKKLKRPNDYIINNFGFTNQQIESSPFVYIQHVTFHPSLRLILEHGKLQDRLSLSRQQIPVHYGLAGAYEDEFHIESSAYQLKQFPGVYTTLMTQYDLLKPKTKEIENGIIFIFSLSLLKQQNWHLNLEDQYGTINNQTFSPINLAKYLNLLKSFYGKDNTELGLFERELIFHDSLPIQLVDCILVDNDETKNEVENMLLEYGYQIPVYLHTRSLRKELIWTKFIRETDEYLNNNLPQLCYTNIMQDYPEDNENITHYMNNFRDINPYKLERIDNVDMEKEKAYVWQKMLENCNINEKYQPEKEKELFKKIEDRLQALYFEDAPRIPVKEENLPPFKYTPEWY